MNVKAISLKKVFLSISMVAALSMSFVGLSSGIVEQRVEAAAKLPGLNASYYSKALFNGKYRESVKKIQQHYNRFATRVGSGEYITADGYFGNDTETAIKKFQQYLVDNKYSGFSQSDVDGIVGSKTWGKLRWY